MYINVYITILSTKFVLLSVSVWPLFCCCCFLCWLFSSRLSPPPSPSTHHHRHHHSMLIPHFSHLRHTPHRPILLNICCLKISPQLCIWCMCIYIESRSYICKNLSAKVNILYWQILSPSLSVYVFISFALSLSLHIFDNALFSFGICELYFQEIIACLFRTNFITFWWTYIQCCAVLCHAITTVDGNE